MEDTYLLNEAQMSAVQASDNHLLVIAGAGSGKTRTIVYRLAELVRRGVSPHSMLLLTFTRKASHEMLQRASSLLGSELTHIQGGTFHGFAYSMLRQFPPVWAKSGLNILDASDSASIISNCKDSGKIGKGDRSFPKNQTILGLVSKSRNKEVELGEILRRESQHLLPYLDDIQKLAEMYVAYRREHSVLDYDDLLFELEEGLRTNDELRKRVQERYVHIMVDEYQDTNRVQARLVRLIAGDTGHVMAVGDDAQSIYAFRGANVQNILEFPKHFTNTQVVRLEENYRSVQPILDVANAILANAPSGFQKNLFSHRKYEDGVPRVQLYRPLSDLSQSRLMARRISELLITVSPVDVAVLFRAGYHSYHLEVELTKLGIAFKKYGGVKYTEASHIKDVLSYARLLVNPLDLPAFERIASLCKGVGPKTAHKLFSFVVQGGDGLEKACAKCPEFWGDLMLIMKLQKMSLRPEQCMLEIVDHYHPRMELLYPDDWPRRQQGLDELVGIAATYDDLALFMADLSLENPRGEDDNETHKITLSTVHSAKGLEWGHVLILDLVEERFPSRHAMTKEDDYEEERRLLYVAVTRAKDSLSLFVPQNLFQRGQGFEERAVPSPFVQEIPSSLYEEIHEQYGGMLLKSESSQLNTYEKNNHSSSITKSLEFPKKVLAEPDFYSARGKGTSLLKKTDSNASQKSFGQLGDSYILQNSPKKDVEKLGYCRHKVFGRGKIIETIDHEKVRVNFTGFGLKVIMKQYLELE